MPRYERSARRVTVFAGRLAVLTLLLGLAGALVGQDTNLIDNSGFAEGAKGWIVGTVGTIDPQVYKTPEITNDAADTNSLRVVATGLWETVATPQVRVEPAVEYRVSAWLRLKDAHQAHVKLNWLSAAGDLVATDYLCTGTDGTLDWYEQAAPFTSPATAAFVQLCFLSGGKPERPGTLWIDRVVFSRRTAPATPLALWQQSVAALYGPAGMATPMQEKVIYYDVRHDLAGVSGIDALVHFFRVRGFAVKNADELKAWMDERITRAADGTVCILAMGAIPDVICENRTSPTLKRYLEAGGRAVWIGDVPLFYLSHTDRLLSDCGWGAEVIGYQDGPWNSRKPGTITAAGRQWGVERLDDTAARPVTAASVTIAFSEQPETRLACSYFINYNRSFPYSGFIRYFGASGYLGEDTSFNHDLYRVALFRGAAVSVPEAPAWVSPRTAEAVSLSTPFRNYKRGDTVRARIGLQGKGEASGISLSLLEGARIIERFAVPLSASPALTIETADLAPEREYALCAEITERGGVTTTAECRFYVAAVRTPKLPVGVYSVAPGSTREKTDIILRDLAAHLGEGGLISLYPTDDYSYIADQALRHGLRVVGCSSCYYSAALPADRNPELHMRLANGELPIKYHYACLGDGRAPVCMGNPVNRERINDFLKQEVAHLADYPAFANRFFVSDDCGMFGDPGTNQLVCYCGYCQEAFKALTGRAAPLTAAAEILQQQGVVDDQETWYRWMRFRTGAVYGEWNRSMRQAAQAVAAGIRIAPLPAGMAGSPVLHAPWAFNPPDNYAGTGISSYYYYPALRIPPICQLVYGELAMMGNRQNELWPMPQSSDYARVIADQGLHAALVKGQYFNLLAAGAAAIVYFNYPLMPGTQAWEEFRTFAPVGVSFGPLLRQSPKTSRQVAVLASFCDAAYRWCKADGPPPNYETLYLELRRNSIQADFISDEEISAGGLAGYRVLVVGNDSYMLRAVQSRIQEFAAGGGTVLLDSASRITLVGAQATAVAAMPLAALAAAPQAISTTSPAIIATEFDAGSARLFVLANSGIDEPATGNVAIPGYVLYRLREGQGFASGDAITLAPGDGALIFAVPTAPAAISVRASAAGISATVIGADGRTIPATFPIRCTVFDPAGREVAGYSDTYATTAGELLVRPFLARNDLSGDWTAEIQELASGLKARVRFTKAE